MIGIHRIPGQLRRPIAVLLELLRAGPDRQISHQSVQAIHPSCKYSFHLAAEALSTWPRTRRQKGTQPVSTRRTSCTKRISHVYGL
jgi:hypothetical protein